MTERAGADATARRLARLGEPHGVWPYRTQCSCPTGYPKDDPITAETGATKREVMERDFRFW